MANVMIIDMCERVRDDLTLYYTGINPQIRHIGLYQDLTRLLDYTHQSDTPLTIVTYKGFTDHLSEIKGHPAFQKARVINKETLDAFDNFEIADHIRRLGTNELVLAGYSLIECIAATARSAEEKGYSVLTAKTLLYTRSMEVMTRPEMESIEVSFAELHDTVEGLCSSLVSYPQKLILN